MGRLAGAIQALILLFFMPEIDVLQTPTECLMRWISDIERVREERRYPEQEELLRDMTARAQSRWMKHDISVDAASSFFSEMIALCARADIPELLLSAQQREAELEAALEMLASPHAAQRLRVLKRLNENLHGRLFESVLMDTIIKRPTATMRGTLATLGIFFLDIFRRFEPAEKERILRIIKGGFSQRWTFDSMPDMHVERLARPDRDDLTTIQTDLEACLFSPMDIRTDLGLLPYVHLVTDFGHKAVSLFPKYAPWRENVIKYYEIMLAARSRDPSVKEAREDNRFGITLSHQPKLERNITRTARAMDFLGGVDLEHIKPPAENAILHGHPFVCGISSHTMSMLHAIAYAKTRHSNPVELDPKYFLLMYMAHMVDTGSHSMQEALWVAYQLDVPLHLGLGALWNETQRAMPFRNEIGAHYTAFTEASDQVSKDQAKQGLITCAFASAFTADFEAFFRAFDSDEETRNTVALAQEKAWKETIVGIGKL